MDFCNCHPGDNSSPPGLEVIRDYNCSYTGLYIPEKLKSCCLRVWLLISLKLVLNEIPPLGTLTGLGILSITGTYK